MTCGCDARRTEDRTESVRAEESICVLSIATVGFATNSASVVIGAPTAMPVPDQVLARTHPTLDDLEVAICAGFAAAYMLVRRESLSALPGVAIAVALVPPLCSAGILLYFGA
ncbi:MAG: DUF389 domain-containing protein, partial [Chromatiaceae bacterium]|nr:DUF389 domain-containing protein [Chromatiaceae bacterium]